MTMVRTLLAATMLSAGLPAAAVVIAVDNASFEQLPPGGLPFACGTA